MRSALANALEALALLDRDLAVLRDHADILAADTCATARRLSDVRMRLARCLTNTRELREELLCVGGDSSEHYQEVALRERIAAIEARLGELVLSEYEVLADAHVLYTGRFSRLADVCGYVLAVIKCVVDACFIVRLGDEHWPDPERSADLQRSGERYRKAIRSAHNALISLGADEDVAQFLRRGATVTSEPFRIACRSIAILLDVRTAPAHAEVH